MHQKEPSYWKQVNPYKRFWYQLQTTMQEKTEPKHKQEINADPWSYLCLHRHRQKIKISHKTLTNSALTEEKRLTNIPECNTSYRGKRSFSEAGTAPPTGGHRTAWTYQTRRSDKGDCPATTAAFDGGGDACGHNLAGWGRYRTPQGQRHWRDLSRVSLGVRWVGGAKGEEEEPKSEKPGDKVWGLVFISQHANAKT